MVYKTTNRQGYTQKKVPYRQRFAKKYDRKKTIKKKQTIEIRPDIDESLLKVFEAIGIPERTTFIPDDFQLKSLEAIETSDCLVCVPTGAGKTWIAEQAIAKSISKGTKAWYASPLKALSNSKFIEFSNIFGQSNVGILTGDRKENFDAPIVVGTTEILRNQLYDAMHRGEDLDADLVVLDEAHFLGDADRGVVWEEVIIYLPKRIPLLLLSATVGNGQQIANWLSYIRERKCVLIEETKRPVPLFQLFFHPSGKLFPLLDINSGLYPSVSKFLENPIYMSHPNSLPPLGEILKVLKRFNLLPAIFFLKSRLDCNNALETCSEPPDEDPSRTEKRKNYSKNIIEKYPLLANHKHLWHLRYFAVGAHHSGQLPAWKIIIETLMSEGLLDAVFATSTVAAGVNFPARTVVFLNSDRYNGHEFVPLDPTEFHQMTGRAGRRGADHIGFTVIVPGRFMDIKLMADLSTSPPSNVLSQIKVNFSMALNLLLSHKPDKIEQLLEKSFATFLILKEKKLSHKRKKEARTRLWREFNRHLNFLKKSGFVDDNNSLTPDGIWTSQLRVDQPLLIAEGIRNNVFPESPELLAALIAPFINEREYRDLLLETQNQTLLKCFKTMIDTLRPMAKSMRMHGFVARDLYFQPAVTLYAWATGTSWEKVVSISEMAEGDLAMMIMRTADNLRHAATLINVFPKLAETSRLAIDLILREPVIMDIQSLKT